MAGRVRAKTVGRDYVQGPIFRFRLPDYGRQHSWTILRKHKRNKSYSRIQNADIPRAGRLGAERGGAKRGQAVPGEPWRVVANGTGRSRARRGDTPRVLCFMSTSRAPKTTTWTTTGTNKRNPMQTDGGTQRVADERLISGFWRTALRSSFLAAGQRTCASFDSIVTYGIQKPFIPCSRTSLG